MRCFRRLWGISYRDRVTNEEVRKNIRHAFEPYEDLMTYNHCEKKIEMVWAQDKINRTCKDDLTGHGSRREKERQTKKRWEDKMTEWT